MLWEALRSQQPKQLWRQVLLLVLSADAMLQQPWVAVAVFSVLALRWLQLSPAGALSWLWDLAHLLPPLRRRILEKMLLLVLCVETLGRLSRWLMLLGLVAMLLLAVQRCFNVAAWTKSLAMTLLRAPRGRKSAESLSLTIPWEALGRGAQAERPAEEPMTESSRGSLVLGMQKTLAHATAVTTCATRGASDLASALCSQGCRMTLHASDSVKSTAEVLQSQGPKIAHVVCATSSALCQGAAELKAALQTAAEKLPNPPAEKPPNTGVRGLRRRTDTPERRPDGVAHAAPLAPVQRRGDGEAARELKVARCAQAAQKRWKDAASNSMKASLKPRPRLPLQKAGAGHRTHASSNSPLHVLR